VQNKISEEEVAPLSGSLPAGGEREEECEAQLAKPLPFAALLREKKNSVIYSFMNGGFIG